MHRATDVILHAKTNLLAFEISESLHGVFGRNRISRQKPATLTIIETDLTASIPNPLGATSASNTNTQGGVSTSLARANMHRREIFSRSNSGLPDKHPQPEAQYPRHLIP